MMQRMSVVFVWALALWAIAPAANADPPAQPKATESSGATLTHTSPAQSPPVRSVTAPAMRTVAPAVASDAARSAAPSVAPSAMPTVAQSAMPSVTPLAMPSVTPLAMPSVTPSAVRSVSPSVAPTRVPSPAPTAAAPTAPGAPAAPAAPAAVVVQPADQRPYLGRDGIMHFPVDGHGDPNLSCVPLFLCDVALQANETVLNIATGDSARWLIASARGGPAGNTPYVLIKPTLPGLRTNLVVTTTRRVYYMMLNSTGSTPYSRLAFFYPADDAARAAASAAALAAADHAREAARQADLPLQPAGPLDTAYRQWGEAALLPAKIYNDGTHTFVEYGRLPTDLPVLYAVSPDGNDQIVNYRVKDRLFVVDGIAPALDLVVDAGTGRNGRGERRAHIRHL